MSKFHRRRLPQRDERLARSTTDSRTPPACRWGISRGLCRGDLVVERRVQPVLRPGLRFLRPPQDRTQERNDTIASEGGPRHQAEPPAQREAPPRLAQAGDREDEER